MVASPRQRLIVPLAPTGAAVVGVFTAAMFLILPSGALESFAIDSGIASVLNAAQPPLGFTARAVLALTSGGICAGLVWVALFVAVGTRAVILNGTLADIASLPTLRRADAHPDAPPRQPVFANRDLGTPFLEVRAEPSVAIEPREETVPAAVPMGPAGDRAVPGDLDLTLAVFDPQSFAALPAETVAPEPTMRTEFAPIPIRRNTSQTLDLIAARMQPQMQPAPQPTPHAPADDSASIRALLDRLERSVAQRETTPPATRQDSIRETLESLRGLATRTG